MNLRNIITCVVYYEWYFWDRFLLYILCTILLGILYIVKPPIKYEKLASITYVLVGIYYIKYD